MEGGHRSLLTAPLLAEAELRSGSDADAAADVILDIRDAGSLRGNELMQGYSSESVEGDVEVAAPAGGEDSNPFDFLGAAPFRYIRRPCSLDPFRNHTPTVEGVYEFSKIVLCLPLALVRLVLFGLSLVVGFLATKLALLRWKDKQSPMPRWRCRLMWITRLCARLILFSFG